MQYSFKFFWLVVVISIAAIISGIESCKKESTKDPDPVNNNSSYYASLKGNNEVPANASTASGTVAATYNKDTKILTVTINYSGMTVNAGHIHKGAIGISGPVVFPFTSTTSPIVFTSAALDATQEADLMANLYYVNLHSTTFPAGEIRGQLFPDNVVSFNADLKGASEVPPNNSTAAGTSYAAFNKNTKILTVTTVYSGMIATDGHIHNGEVGIAGPVVFPLTITPSPIVFTSAVLSAQEEVDLMAYHYYVNLHSTAFPAGEIRGQLIKN